MTGPLDAAFWPRITRVGGYEFNADQAACAYTRWRAGSRRDGAAGLTLVITALWPHGAPEEISLVARILIERARAAGFLTHKRSAYGAAWVDALPEQEGIA